MLSLPLRPLIAAAAIALGAASANAATVAAVDLLNTPSTVVGSSAFTVGYRFKALTDLNVTALGAYDDGQDGFDGRADIGLYTLDGTLLGSIGLAGSDGYLVSQFRYGDLSTPIRLMQGTEYVLGSWSNDPRSFFNANYGAVGGGRVSLDSSVIQLLRNRDVPGVSSLIFPWREPSNTHLGSFGPNMLVNTDIAPIPVPAAGALLLSGAAALAMLRRRRRA